MMSTISSNEDIMGRDISERQELYFCKECSDKESCFGSDTFPSFLSPECAGI